MTLDERIEALVMTAELLTRDVEELRDKFQTMGGTVESLGNAVGSLATTVESLLKIAQQDGENIRALAGIAEMHERRITDIEGGQPH